MVALLIPYFLATRPDLIRPSALAGAMFMLLYISLLLFMNFIFRGFIAREWNFNGLWGVFIFGIPLEEYVYGFFLGMIFGTVYEEIKNLKFVRKRT